MSSPGSNGPPPPSMTIPFNPKSFGDQRALEFVLQDQGFDHRAKGKQTVRPTVTGKFLQAGDERLWVKGVTYGTFAPDAAGRQFPSQSRIAEDFALMRRFGVNTVRTYTVPDRALLDLAEEHDLRLMVGLAWAHHVAFLDGRRTSERIRREIIANVRTLANHPAILLWALGNEIPAAVVR